MIAVDKNLGEDYISDADLKKMSVTERKAYFASLPTAPNYSKLLKFTKHAAAWRDNQIAEAQAKAQVKAQADAQARSIKNKRVQMVVFRSSLTKRVRQAAPTE